MAPEHIQSHPKSAEGASCYTIVFDNWPHLHARRYVLSGTMFSFAPSDRKKTCTRHDWCFEIDIHFLSKVVSDYPVSWTIRFQVRRSLLYLYVKFFSRLKYSFYSLYSLKLTRHNVFICEYENEIYVDNLNIFSLFIHLYGYQRKYFKK